MDDDIVTFVYDKRSLKDKAKGIVGYKVILILDGRVKPEDIIETIEENALTSLIASYGDDKEITLIYPVMPDKSDFEMLSMVKGIKSIDDSLLK